MWLREIAVKRAISKNFNHGGMIRPFQGLVLHIQQGKESGTYSWFNDDRAQASAHFGNPKHGHLEQFVDINDVAWAQMAGNHRWISVENEGMSGDGLTPSQIDNLANLMAWLHWNEDVPLKLANNPHESGLGYHAMGGQRWGGHLQCPGTPIIYQRTVILERARYWTQFRTPGWFRQERTAEWYQWSTAD
jgi:hypothetical protein